jgi:hypothetical protein
MKRLLTFLFTLFLTFGIGIALTKYYLIWNLEFIEKGGGGMVMCEGDGFGHYSLKEFYDGEKLSFSSASFSSKQMADKCFQQQLQQVSKIIERAPLFDKAGEKVVGERVIAVFPPNEFQNRENVAIISLDEDRIYETASFSLRHALMFDKRSRRY